MENKTITQLVLAAREGDAAAYEELYRLSSRQMLGLARSMLKNEQDALDVLQDSYLYAFKSLEGLEHPEYFNTWLYRIVANRCKNFLTRTRPKLFAASLTDEDGGDRDMGDDDIAFQPDESVDYSETKRLVREMVEALPEDQRACVLLYYYQERKVVEIAELLELPENTVKSRLNYARKKIRTQAEALEASGTILHGAALPLLPAAFADGVAEIAAANGPALLEGILQGVGTAAATGGAAAATATAAGGTAVAAAGTAATGGLAFLGTAAGKVAVAVAIAAITVTGSVVAITHQSAPEPEPEPVPVVETAAVTPEPVLAVPDAPEREPEPVYIFNGGFEDQGAGLPYDEFHLRVKISEPCAIYEFSHETADIYIGLEDSDSFRIHYSGTGGSADAPKWSGTDGLLTKTGGAALNPTYEVSGEGGGILELLWTDGADSYVRCRIHISVPGEPPVHDVQPEPQPLYTPIPDWYTFEVEFNDTPEPETIQPVPPQPSAPTPAPTQPATPSQPDPDPEPASDPEPDAEPVNSYYSVSYAVFEEDGTASDEITFYGIELDNTYAVVLNNEIVSYQTYEEYATYIGLEVISVSEAQDMGLLQNVSISGNKLSFSTTAERYGVGMKHEGSTYFGYGQPGTLPNHHEFKVYDLGYASLTTSKTRSYS